MNLRYFHRLACLSFYVEILKGYFITFYIIIGLIEAFLFSFFIYLAYYHISLPIVDTISGVLALFLFLSQKKEVNFWAGFFIGIFWFYWIALSFRYYDLTYLIPFIVLLVAIVYALIFLIISTPKNPFIRAFFILFISYFHPFEFSWFKPELIFINSYLGVKKIDFAITLFSLSLAVYLYKKKRKFISILPLLLLIFSFTPLPSTTKKFKNIVLYNQKLPQDVKWLPRYKEEIIRKDFKAIKSAIKKKKEMIILNESAFPLCLNKHEELLNELKRLSKKIIIITGALKCEDNGYYNSTYYITDDKIKIADKVILVPFGEKIPLPEFLTNFINRIFFNGAEDFKTAKNPTVIKIGDKNYTNAICYEATEDIIYKNSPKYIIATSNNAWFTPSIEPTLQNLLLKYYSKIHKTTIFHSANMGISQIISYF